MRRKNIDILDNVWRECSTHFRGKKMANLKDNMKEPETNIKTSIGES
jgi:hypothetical protein